MLGYFDNQNHIWIWGWLLNDLNFNTTKICRGLLDYGLKLEPKSNATEHFFIKSLLVNSRVQVDEDAQLDINLAINSAISGLVIFLIRLFSIKYHWHLPKLKK